MRPSLLLVLLALLPACGPDLSSWKGTWAGNAAVNTGRQPEVAPGGLLVGDSLVASLTLGPWGTPALRFTCTLVATSADAAKAEFVAQAACDVEKSAGDDCAYGLLFTAATGQRDGEALTLDATGRLTTTCASGSSAVDMGVQLSASRR